MATKKTNRKGGRPEQTAMEFIVAALKRDKNASETNQYREQAEADARAISNVLNRSDVIPVGTIVASSLADDHASIIAWKSDTVVRTWVPCLGQKLSKHSYPELHNAIGTRFGSGAMDAEFKVPDYRSVIFLRQKEDEDPDQLGVWLIKAK